MRALVVGHGSIGRRHLNNLRQLVPGAELAVLRRIGAECSDSAVTVVRTMADAIAFHPEFAVVASPAVFHISDCQALAEAGIHLLVEKPISHTLDGVRQLIRLCEERSVVLMVGYHLRFSPALRVMRETLRNGRIGQVLTVRAEMGQWLPNWRPDSDYRAGVSARSALGGGVILELSHEFDYLRWLLGEVDEVLAVTDRISGLDIDVEDTAEIILRFRSGVLASVHLDMVQHQAIRYCRLVGTQGTLYWDGLTHQVRLLPRDSREWVDLYPASAFERNQMFLDELTAFVACTKTGTPPEISGTDGLHALEIACAAKASSAARQAIRCTAST